MDRFDVPAVGAVGRLHLAAALLLQLVLAQVRLGDALHAVDLDLDVAARRQRVGHPVQRLLVHLDQRKQRRRATRSVDRTY